MKPERVLRIADFRAALRKFERRNEEVSRRWDLTPQRYLLLLFIQGASQGANRITFTQLAERLQLSANTVTGLVARAESAGLVEREGAEHDQRVVYLSLTAEGDRRLTGALEESDEYRRELSSAFDKLVSTFRTAQG
jgi:DNA-binding MarR family transcriptional regulator